MPKQHCKDTFVCTDCSVEFKSKVALENHSCVLKYDTAMEVEIGEDALSRPVNVITSPNNESAYKCMQCGKVFKTLRGCNVHMSHCHPTDKSATGSPLKEEAASKNPVHKIPRKIKDLCVSTVDSDIDVKLKQDSLKKKNKRYVCSKCPQVCFSLNEYRKHVRDSHDVASDYLKSETYEKASDPLMPETHKITDNYVLPVSNENLQDSSKKRLRQYVCSKCPQVCTSIAEYRKHVRNCSIPVDVPSTALVPITSSTVSNIVLTASTNIVTASVDLLHECPNCSQKFRKIGSYRRHLRTHLNIHAYKCKHCLISYLTKSQLKAHIQHIHFGVEKQHVCSLCNKKFYHSIGFRKHKSEHLSTPPYQCFKCDAVFPSVSKQVTHISNHAVSCSFCRKPFANEEELWVHASTEHKEDKEDADFLSEASDCEGSDSNDEFSEDFNEVDIESDADSYTSVESDSEGNSPEKVPVYSPNRSTRCVKGHTCFICERRFPKQRSLDLHMKTHKIHSCMACPKFFAHSAELKAHQQEHFQNNSFFYSKAFNDLQLTLQQQPPPPVLGVVPADVVTEPQNISSKTGSQPTAQGSTTDFIAWYADFKKVSEKLKFPISYDLYQSINQIIAELATTLYSPEEVPQDTKDSYIKIYEELTCIISKNAQKNKLLYC